MSVRHRIKGRWAPLFAVLMLLALVMRVAVPAGFMPTASDGGVVVSICTGDGALSRVIDIGAKHTGEKNQDDGGQGHCTYASAGGGTLVPDLSGEPGLLRSRQAPPSPGTAFAHAAVHRLASPPPPSQAPPAQA